MIHIQKATPPRPAQSRADSLPHRAAPPKTNAAPPFLAIPPSPAKPRRLGLFVASYAPPSPKPAPPALPFMACQTSEPLQSVQGVKNPPTSQNATNSQNPVAFAFAVNSWHGLTVTHRATLKPCQACKASNPANPAKPAHAAPTVRGLYVGAY